MEYKYKGQEMIQNWNNKDYRFKDKIIPIKFLFKRGPMENKKQRKGKQNWFRIRITQWCHVSSLCWFALYIWNQQREISDG